MGARSKGGAWVLFMAPTHGGKHFSPTNDCFSLTLTQNLIFSYQCLWSTTVCKMILCQLLQLSCGGWFCLSPLHMEGSLFSYGNYCFDFNLDPKFILVTSGCDLLQPVKWYCAIPCSCDNPLDCQWELSQGGGCHLSPLYFWEIIIFHFRNDLFHGRKRLC